MAIEPSNDPNQWQRPQTADEWKEVARYWKNSADSFKQKYSTEHQRYVSLYNSWEDLKNEFNGLLRKKMTSEELALAELLSDYSAHTDIQDIVKNAKPSHWMKFGWELAFTIIGLVFLWQVATNQAFREVISKNIFAIGIFLFAGAVIIYWLRQQNSKGKK